MLFVRVVYLQCVGAPLYRKLDEENDEQEDVAAPKCAIRKNPRRSAGGGERERDKREGGREGGSRMDPEITDTAHNTVWYHIDG